MLKQRCLFILVFLMYFAFGITHAQQPYVAGEVLIRISSGADISAIHREIAKQAIGGWRAQRSPLAIKVKKVISPSGVVVQKQGGVVPPGNIQGQQARARLDRYYKLSFDPSAPVETVLEELQKVDGVEVAEPNYLYHVASQPAGIPNDTYCNSVDQYGLFGVYVPQAWEIAKDYYQPVVAVIDTGVNYTHSDIAANMWNDGAGHCGWDFYDNDSSPMDMNGHGTHVAGIIGAISNNGIGISGIATSVRIMAVKIFSNGGDGGTSEMVAQAINYARQQGADVINMSIGGPYSSSVADAVDAAVASGCLLVAAAGNDGEEEADVNYPAAFTGVVSVAALNDSLDGYATALDWGEGFGSNFGSTVELTAPGTDILSLYNSSYGEMSGTSMATPFVSGLAALMKQSNPYLTASSLRLRLREATDDIGGPGWDKYFGYGKINAYKAICSIVDEAAPVVSLSGPGIIKPGGYAVLSVREASRVDSLCITINSSEGNCVATGSLLAGSIAVLDADDYSATKLFSFHLPQALSSGQYELYAAAADERGYVLDSVKISSFEIRDVLMMVGPTDQDASPVAAPSPFNPLKQSLHIGCRLTRAEPVIVRIYDLNGQEVKAFEQLSPTVEEEGYYDIVWDGRGRDGVPVKNGVYLVLVTAGSGNEQITKKTKVAVLN